MTGLLIVTHADFAAGLLRAAESILGPVSQAETVSICRQDSPDEMRQRLKASLKKVTGDGEGAIIMTDMFGGTPANISLPFLQPGQVEILTGVNLPMVLKFCNSRETTSVPELAALLKDYGQKNISLASDFLRR